MNMQIPSEEQQRTSDLLESVVVRYQEQEMVSIGEIMEALHERGFGVITVIAALPIATPFPAPPLYSTVFAIPLFILSLQMLWGKQTPWLPGWIKRRRIKHSTLALLVRKGNPILRRIERFLKPRFTTIPTATWEKLVGIAAFVFTISIAVPLPLTNTIPGVGVVVMATGLLSRDGLMMAAGMLIGLVGCILTTSIVYALITGAEFAFGGITEADIAP